MGRAALGLVLALTTFAASGARAEEAPPVSPPPPPGGATVPLTDLERAPPPPTNVVYLQYGVAFTAEMVSAPGPICDATGAPCVLGGGGGIAVRMGWRGTGALYLGGAYEVSKQDPNNLYRIALLQQFRGEARYYYVTGRDTEPYGALGLGVSGYGNEWGIDTWGPGGYLGVGVETQLTRRTVVGVGLAYRLLWFKSFTDTSGAPRHEGLAQLVGLDFVLEVRDPIFTSRSP